MKLLYTTFILIIFLSCTNKRNRLNNNKIAKVVDNYVLQSKFQLILDSANIEGAILVYSSKEDKYYSNNFEWAKKGQLPASTFKIPHSIIALETGIIKNDTTLFKWSGEKRAIKIWEQDLNFKDAFHFSCTPCYQEVAKKIGIKKMTKYLSIFNYGLIKIDSTSIDNFWLEGDSRINQFQQIDFLKKLYLSKLPISERTKKIIKKIMLIEKNEDYHLSGKTGWSIKNGKDNGWFVGYVETDNDVYFFATNIEPKKQFNIDMFSRIRTEVTYIALKKMNIIN